MKNIRVILIFMIGIVLTVATNSVVLSTLPNVNFLTSLTITLLIIVSSLLVFLLVILGLFDFIFAVLTKNKLVKVGLFYISPMAIEKKGILCSPLNLEQNVQLTIESNSYYNNRVRTIIRQFVLITFMIVLVLGNYIGIYIGALLIISILLVEILRFEILTDEYQRTAYSFVSHKNEKITELQKVTAFQLIEFISNRKSGIDIQIVAHAYATYPDDCDEIIEKLLNTLLSMDEYTNSPPEYFVEIEQILIMRYYRSKESMRKEFDVFELYDKLIELTNENMYYINRKEAVRNWQGSTQLILELLSNRYRKDMNQV